MSLLNTYLDYGVDLVSRVIYLSGEKSAEINAMAAERFIISMDLLVRSATKRRNKIHIILNTIGGDFFHALAIFDTIRLCPYPVSIEVRGQAFSAGAIILQAASSGRYMSFNSRLMMHHGSDGMSDHPKIFKNWARESERGMQWQTQLFFDRIKEVRTDITEKNVDKMLDFDTILSAHEALELNLIDAVLLPGKVETREDTKRRRQSEKVKRATKPTRKR